MDEAEPYPRPAPSPGSAPSLGLSLVLALWSSGAFGAPRDRPAALSGRALRLRETMTPEVRHAIARGFHYLLRQQRQTRSFRGELYPVAANALAGLALLAAGHDEEAGPVERVEALRLATTTLLTYQSVTGYFDDRQSRMYGHGFATLYLAELYGMSRARSRALRDSLRRAIRVIEHSQTPEGGWDYEPGRPFSEGTPQTSDTSITVCQTMALRAARNLGLQVDALVVERAQRYIRGAQNRDGGFRYRSTGPWLVRESDFPRSAAGVCILYSLGDYSSPQMRRGLHYLERNYRDDGRFPFYARYYCAQAFLQVGGRPWQEYWGWVRGRLVTEQRRDGSWQTGPLELERSRHQTTAMALIVLQLPWGFLPIHER